MAIIFNCAVDWSLDLAWNDASKVTALPFKRGLVRKTETIGQQLFQYLKTDAKFFVEEQFDGKMYNNDYGFVYAGDAWLKHLDWDCISDWYKEAYGQRPHFNKIFFAKMCGLPTQMETAMFFCNPVENYLEEARWNRERMYE